jgi:hypothetical protein
MKMYAILIFEDYESCRIHNEIFKTLQEAEEECKSLLKKICGNGDGDSSTCGIVQEMEVVES